MDGCDRVGSRLKTGRGTDDNSVGVFTPTLPPFLPPPKRPSFSIYPIALTRLFSSPFRFLLDTPELCRRKRTQRMQSHPHRCRLIFDSL